MSSNLQFKNTVSTFFFAAMFVAMFTLPEVALAQTAETRVEGFLSKVQGLLNIASVSIVTIAVIFAGYQIAFAHKRISDVAPILIGGFLIGAAAQLAKMVIPEDSTTTASIALNALSVYA